jgi:hypothetical protein
MMHPMLPVVFGAPAFVAQAGLGVPVEGLIAQAPAFALLVWYLSQRGKRDAEAEEIRQRRDAERDRVFIEHLSASEQRLERAEDRHAETLGRFTEEIARNTRTVTELVRELADGRGGG